MSLEEKVGQLFVAPFSPLRGEDHWSDWERLLKSCHVGAAIVKASDPKTQIVALNRLQELSSRPLLIAADAEWGLGMRMTETISFPRNLTLGAVADLTLLEQMGRWIGMQAKEVGIHLNLAPVADVNNNALNPIIHMRSFGEDPQEVSRRSLALIRGMQKESLLCCVKHFPGHGDTSFDSHRSLPVIDHSLDRIKQVELVPFQAAIAEGVDCVMSGHLLFPALDTLPASLSQRCIRHLLRDELGFEGLAVTDALNMAALAEQRSVEEIALLAYEAGHDLLLYGAHLKEDVDELINNQVPRAYRALHQAFLSGRLSVAELDQRVKRILRIKERCPAQPLKESPSLLHPDALALKRELFRKALTLQGGPLPTTLPSTYFAIGGQESDWMVKTLRQQGIKVLCLDPQLATLPALPTTYFVGLHRAKGPQEGFGLSSPLKSLLQQSPLTLLFCTPYALQLFSGVALIAYENDPDAQEAAYDALLHRLQPSGALPVLK